tara:strand:- start:579 stop:926 length:348 start_codon:yes stop_codon:yes gene_type:complete
MTVYVTKTANTIAGGIAHMIEGANEDYMNFPVNDTMKAEFVDEWVITPGSKYIKILRDNGGSAWGFVVKTDTDKKFKKGDILKCAGYSAPARNKARGNVLEGNYPINWTGPVYLK